jgi:hypothetical protein
VLVDRRGAQHVVIQFKAIEKTVLPHSSDCTIIEQSGYHVRRQKTRHKEESVDRKRSRNQKLVVPLPVWKQHT